MIVLESGEVRYGLYNSLDYKECDFLERITGADIMVSPISIPPRNKELLQKHIECNSFLVQRKSGMDFIDSIPRLNEHLLRMIECGSRQSCRILMTIGKWEMSPSGYLVIDGDSTIPYLHAVMAISAWNDRGGVHVHLDSNSMIPEYLTLLEKNAVKYKEHPEPKLFFRQELPVQALNGINDWRRTIATFPMIGTERASVLRDHMLKADTSDDLLTALVWLTDSRKSKDVKGIALAIRSACRAWLGLPDGWNLDITHESEE